MPVIDYATVIGRAAWVRHKAGLIGMKPPYSTRHVLETLYPHIPVSGADLPPGVTEMAIAREGGQRALFYSRKVSHVHQRVGLIHGLYHHISDLKGEIGLKECSLSFRKLQRINPKVQDPNELACDLFAGEVLTPLDILDEYAPATLYSREAKLVGALDDEIDSLSSRFNVPRGFMKWRLWDLQCFRRSNLNLR